MGDALLQLDDIYHDYEGNNVVINGLQLKIEEGEIIALVGPSGCGKTTLLKILCGLIKPSKGKVLYKGKPVIDVLPTTSFVFQDYNNSLMPWRDVWSNIKLGLEQPNFTDVNHSKVVMEMLNLMHLLPAKHMMPHELSGGMKQRVSIARALAVNPGVLLMDEPFGSLDELSRARLQDEVLAIQLNSQPKKTIVMVTHNLDEALYMSHRIVILSPQTSNIARVIDNNLEWPRDQINTRLTHRFAILRSEIYELMNNSAVT